METQQRYFLSKDDRLKSRKDIELLFREGKTLSQFPLKVFWLRKEEEILRAGFSTGTRSFKKATDRNRIKRLMREAYRLQKHELKSTLLKDRGAHLFFIFIGKELPAYDLIFEKTGKLLRILSKSIHANA